MFKSLLAALAAVLIGCTLPVAGSAKDAPGTWTVKLTNKQAKGLAKMSTEYSTRVFTISPDGAWGSAWDNKPIDHMRKRALANCRQHLKRGRRDCFVYSENGRVVAKPVVNTKVVSKVYKAVNGKTAPSYFGRVPFNFKGNKTAAIADYEALIANPNHAKKLTRSKALKSALTNASFMNTNSSSFAIWFTKGGGSQFSSAQTKTLKLYFSDWVATSDGLVCMFNSVWSSGRRMGTHCLIIDSVQNGVATFYWSRSSKTKRNGQIIAGDARRGAAR